MTSAEVQALAIKYVEAEYGIAAPVSKARLCTKGQIFEVLGTHAYELKDADAISRFMEMVEGSSDDSKWWIVVMSAISTIAGVQTSISLLIDDRLTRVHEFTENYNVSMDAVRQQTNSGQVFKMYKYDTTALMRTLDSWISAKKMNKCPMCGLSRWKAEALWVLPAQDSGGETSFPVVPVVCLSCAYTMFLSTGVLSEDASNPASSEEKER